MANQRIVKVSLVWHSKKPKSLAPLFVCYYDEHVQFLQHTCFVVGRGFYMERAMQRQNFLYIRVLSIDGSKRSLYVIASHSSEMHS